MASTSSSLSRAPFTDSDDWENYNDHGFIYKRKKRPRIVEPNATSSAPDLVSENTRRRCNKRNFLLRLKQEYQREIDYWENLSNTLNAMHEKTQQQAQLPQEHGKHKDTASIPDSIQIEGQSSQENSGSLLDELLLQVETQEAIIHHVSSLCDLAEAMCNHQEEILKQQLFDLPVWDSPIVLLTSLCDE